MQAECGNHAECSRMPCYRMHVQVILVVIEIGPYPAEFWRAGGNPRCPVTFAGVGEEVQLAPCPRRRHPGDQYHAATGQRTEPRTRQRAPVGAGRRPTDEIDAHRRAGAPRKPERHREGEHELRSRRRRPGRFASFTCRVVFGLFTLFFQFALNVQTKGCKVLCRLGEQVGKVAVVGRVVHYAVNYRDAILCGSTV